MSRSSRHRVRCASSTMLDVYVERPGRFVPRRSPPAIARPPPFGARPPRATVHAWSLLLSLMHAAGAAPRLAGLLEIAVRERRSMPLGCARDQSVITGKGQRGWRHLPRQDAHALAVH